MRYSYNSSKSPTGRFILIIILTIVLIGLTGTYFYKRYQPKPASSTKTASSINDVTISSVKAEPVIEKPLTGQYVSQMNDGQNYLLANVDKISPFERLLLDYLQRKFSLSSQFNASVKSINPPVKGDGEDPLQFKVFRRIAYPDKLVDKLPDAKDDSISQMIMEAAYCDRMKLPSDFNQLVDSNIKAGGYNLTHVEFSLHLMQDNNCAYYSSQEDQQIRDQIALLIAALVNKPNTIPDLRYESIAYLMDMGRRDLIQDNWIKQIIAEQQTDGSWNLEKNVKDPNGHTTILAMWALLEYSEPNAISTSMIRH